MFQVMYMIARAKARLEDQAAVRKLARTGHVPRFDVEVVVEAASKRMDASPTRSSLVLFHNAVNDSMVFTVRPRDVPDPGSADSHVSARFQYMVRLVMRMRDKLRPMNETEVLALEAKVREAVDRCLACRSERLLIDGILVCVEEGTSGSTLALPNALYVPLFETYRLWESPKRTITQIVV